LLFSGKILLAIGTTLQQVISQEILNRMSPAQSEFSEEEEEEEAAAELDERQMYSIFHDALFCFEEAKLAQRYEMKVYSMVYSSVC
jgi:type II secretory ATPase GspE/PulE/Tfp pilus assembly ATPase PilB-like protein